jgi:hypothetical protein
MKKHILSFLLISIGTLFITGCSTNQNEQNKPNHETEVNTEQDVNSETEIDNEESTQEEGYYKINIISGYGLGANSSIKAEIKDDIDLELLDKINRKNGPKCDDVTLKILLTNLENQKDKNIVTEEEYNTMKIEIENSDYAYDEDEYQELLKKKQLIFVCPENLTVLLTSGSKYSDLYIKLDDNGELVDYYFMLDKKVKFETCKEFVEYFNTLLNTNEELEKTFTINDKMSSSDKHYKSFSAIDENGKMIMLSVAKENDTLVERVKSYKDGDVVTVKCKLMQIDESGFVIGNLLDYEVFEIVK